MVAVHAASLFETACHITRPPAKMLWIALAVCLSLACVPTALTAAPQSPAPSAQAIWRLAKIGVQVEEFNTELLNRAAHYQGGLTERERKKLFEAVAAIATSERAQKIAMDAFRKGFEPEAAAQVRTVAGEVLGDLAPQDMLMSLEALDEEARAETIQALASGHAGRQLLLKALATDRAVLDEADVRLVVMSLIRAEDDDGSTHSQLAPAIVRPHCQFPVAAIDAMAEVGGVVALRELTAILATGNEALRLAVVQATGRDPDELTDVLVMALDDEVEATACEAAMLLSTGSSKRAGEALLQAARRSRRGGSRLLTTALVRALGAIRHQRATVVLIDILRARGGVWQRRRDGLRAATAQALFDIGTPGALRAVADLGSGRERDQNIRDLASQAAVKIAVDESANCKA